MDADELLTLSDEDLEAASEFHDRLVSGEQYPPEGTKVGDFTIRYLPER